MLVFSDPNDLQLQSSCRDKELCSLDVEKEIIAFVRKANTPELDINSFSG